MRRALTELGLAFVILVLAPVSVRGAEPLDPTVEAAVHDYVVRELEALGVPGAAVAVVYRDAVVYSEGFGTADGETRAVTPQTPFDLASVSKMITAIAVYQQIERGTIGLDDRVQTHLSWFAEAQPALAEVTIADLLGHTSGWTTYDGIVNLLDEEDRDDAIERNARRLAETTPTHDRGTFEYSNANYDVLAHLVETVSGVDFDEYVQGEIFAPLGMTHSHTSRAEATADGASEGFYPFFGAPVPYAIPFAPSGIGSGFMYASAEDLGRLLTLHFQNGLVGEPQVLSTASVQALQRPVSRPSTSDGYAGGLWVYPFYAAGSLSVEAEDTTYQAPIILEHGGDHATTATGVLVMPADGWGVVVLMNMNDGSVASRFHQMHYGIAAIVMGLEPGATSTYEDALSQYWKLVFVAVVAVLVAGIVLAVRRIRDWGRHPDRRPTGSRLLVGHILVPAAADIAVAVAFWWLVLDRSDAPIAHLVRLSPDLFLALVIVTILSTGWGVVRTGLTLLRRPASPTALAEPA